MQKTIAPYIGYTNNYIVVDDFGIYLEQRETMTDKDKCKELIEKVSLDLKTLLLRLDNKVSYNNLGQYALDTEVGSRGAYMSNLVKALGNMDDMLSDAIRGKEV